jgi:hypothetical protein
MTTRARMTPAERDWFEAALDDDLQATNDALVEMNRDPARWFCSGIDGTGMPRIYGRGDSRGEAEANAKEGAEGYIRQKAAFRVMAPVDDWHFIAYEPDPPQSYLVRPAPGT